MKKDIKVEILRGRKKEQIKSMINEKGKYKVLSYFSAFYDRRTYFKVDDEGNISLKDYNPLLILFAFCDDENKLTDYILKYSYPEEKQNFRKIDRRSNLTIKELRVNLIKTLISGNLDFSKIFAKELYLRSEKDFFEVLYTFSLMGNPKNIKLLYVYALEKILGEVKYNEEAIYIVIAYLTKIRDDYSTYINSSACDIEINSSNWNEDKKIYTMIFNQVISKYIFKNINKFKNNLNTYFKEDFLLNADLKEALDEGKL
ncbi:hypothetical protein [Fusobacterium russii]|uniref:hypothetical protein n=1 Tax=Fusobacterium russii TaxID=854 RepID=UPI0003AABEC5|nr:hypothetical protein [Fusobacterium russii]